MVNDTGVRGLAQLCIALNVLCFLLSLELGCDKLLVMLFMLVEVPLLVAWLLIVLARRKIKESPVTGYPKYWALLAIGVAPVALWLTFHFDRATGSCFK